MSSECEKKMGIVKTLRLRQMIEIMNTVRLVKLNKG
jgi:hypothetical protein